jgi:alanine dehydrogenase
VLIGVPKEIKDHEGRVGLVSASVHELVAHGHEVLVETGAGKGAGVLDADFERAGATMVDSAGKIWSTAELIVKVKEPLAVERRQLRAGQFFSRICTSLPIPNRRTI